jgi:Tol biopolymer transport system component
VKVVPLRRMGIVIGVLSALVAPGSAWAHGGGNYTAGAATVAPTVDGVVIADEWADANPYNVVFGSLGNATVRFVHTATDLYVGVVVQDATPGTNPSFDVFFNNRHNGLKTIGDDAWLTFAGGGGSDFFYNPDGTGGPSHYSDLVYGGTAETVGAGTLGDTVMFELKHPLCSADTARDICASVGSTLGVDFQYQRGSPFGTFVSAPGPDIFDPSLNWADLVIAAGDTVAPTARVTLPVAGSVLSGVVNVAADASDNVGVTRVDFSYHDGASGTITPIGSDTDSPYTTTFDSRRFPNTIPMNATVYAEAFDAAGNRTQVGNGVTVNNAVTEPDTFISGPSGIVIGGSATFTFTSDVPAATFACRFDNPGGDFTSCPTPRTFTDLQDGSHTLEVRAVNDTVFDLTPATFTFFSIGTVPPGRIAFESNMPGSSSPGTDIYTMAPDGTDVRHITFSEGSETRPTLSPDGSRIAFESNGDIYIVSATDPSTPVQLTTTGDNAAPAFSPNGRAIAFDSSRAGNWNLYRMPVTGGTPIQITFDGADDTNPSWSPDGSHVVFVSTRSGDREIWTALSKGGAEHELVRLTTHDGLDTDPEWSPDGSTIVFVRTVDYYLQPQVFTMSATTGDGGGLVAPTPISGGPYFSADPTWSPDGSHIAFTRDAGGVIFHLWTATPDGGHQVEIATLGARNSFPSWAGVSASAATITLSGPASATAGAATVPLDDIPASAILGTQTSTTTTPLDTIPLDTIPLDTIPLDTIPLDTIPLDTIGINPALLQNSTLGTIPLDTIHLPGAQTWESLLNGTLLGGVPINTLSLRDVATSAPAVLHSLHLSDLANSPLDTIPLAAVTLTTAPLDTIPIDGHQDQTTNRDDWCNLIRSIPGFATFVCTDIGSETVLGLSMRGVPLDTIPLDTIPLDTIDLRSTPLDTIPLDTIGLSTIQSSPLATVPLDEIDFSKSPLATIPLNTSAADVAQCAAFTCDAAHTLGGAATAAKLLPGATFGQIGAYPGVTLGNLGRGMPPSVTLHDLLALLLGQKTYDWEKLPLDFPVQDYSTNGGTIDYTGTFNIASAGLLADATITVELENGERYVPDSTSFVGISSDDPVVTDSGGVQTLSWDLTGVATGVDHALSFRARSGLTLGSARASAEIAAGAIDATASPVPVNITDTFEPNNDAESAKPAQPDHLQFSYVTSATDKDYFTIPVPAAGVETKIFLSHMPADYDLIVYGPPQQALRAAPLDTIPLDTIAAGDVTPTLQQQSQDLSPESLQDIPVTPPGGTSLLGVSDVRGPGNEEIDLVSTGGGGTYYIEVVGFNGAFSNKPYMLRTEHENPHPLPPCTPRTMGSGGTAGTMPAIPANVDTLFLINEKQFGDLNGVTAETQIVNSLNSLITTANVGFVGAVIPVEADTNVAAKYGLWNANPCDPALANDVARSIMAVVDGIRSTHAAIKNIVLIGGDDKIPMARLADPTPLSNEADYASTFGFSSNNEFVSAFANHYLMSDDPYGDVTGTTYPGGQLYVPELAIGRLVDTPAEITGQLNQFALAHGQLAPSTELTTSYSFLYDGGLQEAAALKAPGRTTQGDLNSAPGAPNQWDVNALTAAMFPATGAPPSIMAINAHYNQRQLLPADQDAAKKTDELYTSAMLAAQGVSALQNRLALTIGCHSGVNAPDTLFSGTAAEDWAQTWLGHGAFGFIGNTGYGLGDDVTVAYSEQLHVGLAKRLDGSLSLGQALIYAKQDYLGTLGQVTSYDAKVINQSTLYGLPMWRLGTGTPAAPPAPGPTFIDPATGNPAQSISLSPTFTRNDNAYGTFFTVNGESVAESRRPIEPSTSVDITQPNLLAHGFLITSLASTDETIDAAFSRPVNDSPTAEPELVGLVTYPTKLQAIRTIATPNGQRQRLVVTVGQYLSDGIPDAKGVGTQRKFTSVSGRALYADPSVHDFTPPGLGAVTVDRVTLGNSSSNVAFAVPVTDESGDPSNVKRVLVLYLDGTTWRSVDLARNGNTWSGAGPIGSQTAVQYFIQAIDLHGNIGVISAKGDLVDIIVPQQTGTGVTVTQSGTGPTNGWFTSAVDVTLGAAAGVTVESSLDGSMFQPVTGTVHVDGSGAHTLKYNASDGSRGTVVIPIDTTPPTVSIGKRTYAFGSTGNQFDVVCADAGSGVASCTPTPSAPDTTSPGTKTFTVHAVDRVGNATSPDVTGTYQVVWPFTGFFSPIANLPTVNQANAGQAVPTKFSLGGNRGLAIFAAGYPKSVQVSCDSSAPLGAPVSTTTAGSSSLSYDAGSNQYNYVWKTDKAWAGSCRNLVLRLVDGTEHVAGFKLK